MAPPVSTTLPDTVSSAIDILKFVSATLSADRSMSPSNANWPITEASKPGGSWPPARTSVVMKSVRPAVESETLPFTSASTAMRLIWPSKFSEPLCTLSLKDMSLPLSVGVPTDAISDSGTPLTVAVPSKLNGP